MQQEDNLIDPSEIDDLTFPEVGKGTAGPEEIVIGTGKKNPKHYVDNKKLSQCLKEWKIALNEAETNKTEKPRVPEYVGECILKIASNMSNKFNFRGYSFRDDMVGDACLNVLSYIENFNPLAPTRSGEPNAFWYISMISHNAFTKRIQGEARQQYYKFKSFEMISDLAEMMGQEDDAITGGEGGQSVQDMYRDMLEKVSIYEEKNMLKKKGKRGKTVTEEETPPLLEFMKDE